MASSPDSIGGQWLFVLEGGGSGVRMRVNDKSSLLIPRRKLFGETVNSQVMLSPDGRHLSYCAPHEGVRNVWVGDGVAQDMAPVTTGQRPVADYCWAFTNHHVLYQQDWQGDEKWQVYCVDIDTGHRINLFDVESAQVRVLQLSYKRPTDVLLAVIPLGHSYADIYSVDILSGNSECLYENRDCNWFIADDDLNIVLAGRMTDDGGREYLRPSAGQWQPSARFPMEDLMTSCVLAHDPAQGGVWMLDSRERDTAALYRLNTKTNERYLVSALEEADIVDVLFHPKTRQPVAVASAGALRTWCALADEFVEDFAYLEAQAPSGFEVLSISLDAECWIVALLGDRRPPQYVLYRRSRKNIKFVCSAKPDLDDLDWQPQEIVTIAARDGLPLSAYYTLPAADKIPKGTVPPMVLLVHGGPWARDDWGFNAQHQWLANRGYSVMSVNFRGSTGFGKAFINAGNREWGGKMQLDLEDTVQWAVDKQLADPARIAIVGTSYGGYAALMAMTRHPSLFCCAVDICGPSNLVSFIDSLPPFWKSMRGLFRTRVGDVDTKEGREALWSLSPLARVSDMNGPVLICQGANDPRVQRKESDQMQQALVGKGLPVTYIVYANEGHGLASPDNRVSFYGHMEEFLACYLGGLHETLTTDARSNAEQIICL